MLDHPKGEPHIVSNTEGEDITPDNPEVIRQTPVDTKDTKEVKRVEDSKVDQFGKKIIIP